MLTKKVSSPSAHASQIERERKRERTKTIKGRCMLMCPDEEKIRRQREKAIHVLEVAKDGRADVTAVKEYVRAGAGHLVPSPDDLRPPAVLAHTMEYLIRNVADRTDYPWYIVYQFISNRIQAIRQDITFQQLRGASVRGVFEMASKFYLYSQYRLWGSPIDKFDSKLNMDHLQQCLATLLRDTPTSPSTTQPLSDEHHIQYEAFYLLINLGNTEVLNRALDLRFHHHPQLKLAFEINMSYIHNNFVRLFRLTGRLSSLFEKCALLLHINTIRTRALQTLATAYSTRSSTFPLELLGRWLLLDSKQSITELCTAHGLEISSENVLFRKGTYHPPAEVPKRCPFIVSELQSAQVNQLILGNQ